MDYLDLGTWLQNFLLIMSGCLVMLLLLLIYSDRYTRKKINQIEQNDENIEPNKGLINFSDELKI
jgi:hypothetical protein